MTAAALASSVRASERRSRAFLRLLAGMCRQFPDLRTWLLEDFGQDAATRANFLALVERGELNGEAMSNGFAELAGELDGWLEEKRRMKAQLPAQAARPFGGLTWEEMEALVRRYEARTLGLNVFLPGCSKPGPICWTRQSARAKPASSPTSAMPLNCSPDLIRAACALLSAMPIGGSCTPWFTCCGTPAKPTARATCGRTSEHSACGSARSTSGASADAMASAATCAPDAHVFAPPHELSVKCGAELIRKLMLGKMQRAE